jgi:putative ABC transport system ATP-binding protein
MLEVNNLTKIYNPGAAEVKALNNVSFRVETGDMVCVMGKSGSGKSTLLRQLGLLDRPTSGEILLDERPVTRLPDGARATLRLQYLGYVFQEYALIGELSAYENVFLPGMMLGDKGIDFKNRARDLLEVVGLANRMHHAPKELSGGEQQRVAIARALINKPKVLFADEPCANLDTISSKMVMETLVNLNLEMKITIVFVSHDPDDKQYARGILVFSDGKIVERDGLKGDMR